MTGQFLSVDPLVQQTLEAYEYANDDPLQNVDPDGSRWFGTVCEYVKATGEHEDDGTICILVNNSDFGLGNQALVRFNSASGTLRAVECLELELTADGKIVEATRAKIVPPNNGTNGYISTGWYRGKVYAHYLASVWSPLDVLAERCSGIVWWLARQQFGVAVDLSSGDGLVSNLTQSDPC